MHTLRYSSLYPDVLQLIPAGTAAYIIKSENKIGLLWCHSYIVSRLIEAKVKLSGTSFRGQFDMFLMVDTFNFVRFVWFFAFFGFFFFFFFFLLSGMILSFLGPYRDFLFWVRFWPEKFFRLFQSKLITLIFILLFSGFSNFFRGGDHFQPFWALSSFVWGWYGVRKVCCIFALIDR